MNDKSRNKSSGDFIDDLTERLKTSGQELFGNIEQFFQDASKSASQQFVKIKTKLKSVGIGNRQESLREHNNNNSNEDGERYTRYTSYESSYLTYYTSLVDDDYVYYITRRLKEDIRFNMLSLVYILKEEYYVSFDHYIKLTSLQPCLLNVGDKFNEPSRVTKVVIYCSRDNILLKRGQVQ